ncbi:Retrovirus-related Pol polyprotein [Thelohanellus kitauei]|uniref:Retrovirus-related Pol polyprotein n=1 Tax=Thelohanellus kitauei TaxID=669202 RepID=A0A0C2IVC8_THEKT|nr:Retrovirus-related Pol polyprotein [Thelohanellus kitauei]
MATRNPENLPIFSRTSDPSSWIFRFQLRAEFEGWSPEKQSSILPTFYDDDLLKEYQNSPMASLPASEKKLKQTMEWMGDISKRSDKLSSDYSKFENMSLAPGQDIRFEMWELDFTGPLPMTKRGNKYIMVCVDHYSKWIEAAAIPDISAETAARVLFTQVVSRFGVPKTILTDQGTAFESKLFTHLCQHLGIEKLRSTAYHPETNGLVERSNKSIKELLRIAVQKDPSDWDMNLDTCLFALRTACNASTGLPPSKIVFGSETQLPKNLSIQDTKMFSAESNHHVYVQKLERVMKSTFQLVDQNLVKSANKQKKSFDNKIYETKYVKGDYVLVKYQQGNKLSQKFEGPFEITGVKHPVYEIREIYYPNRTKRIHHNHLYRCSYPSTNPMVKKTNFYLDPPRRSTRITYPGDTNPNASSLRGGGM